ncbi:sulfatase-like hydrolase/transferase [Haloferula chungangensis]|uniref:Sulfatase-like hydrolase/transferase n=1 Tax=Haloferula chungangensis TaxID=1048331 RepID=A0ABW2L9B0_9BACT
MTKSAAFLAATAFCAVTAAAKSPNIVLIFMDDLGYNDIGVQTYPAPPNQYPVSGPSPKPGGSNSNLPAPNEAYGLTPRIDSLATEGLLMTRFYASSRCSAARASLLTGRYDSRTGVSAVFYPNHSTGMSTTEVTLPELLRQQGYATAMVGKWHLGYNPSKHNPYQMMPVRQGFHEFFGTPHSNDMNSFHLIRNEQIEQADFDSAGEQAQITWRYTEAALDFIERASGDKQPFFLYFAHTMTHRPTWPSDEEYQNADGTTWPKFQGTSGVSYYYDVVKEVDHSVGRVLDKLEDLGIADDTLVVFTSDNGPWTRLSGMDLASSSVGSAYPLRDGKGTTWEGGCRVPFFVRWPGKIASGGTSDEVTGLVDLLPTFVGLAGGELPQDRSIDGVDLAGLWRGQDGWNNPRSAYALFADDGSVGAVLKDEWKLRQGSLFNLTDDIQESTNVAGSQSAVAADLASETDAINTSIANEKNSLGTFTSYEVLVSENDISVPEGGMAGVELSLSADPGKAVEVSVARFSGDSDLSVSAGASLTFDSTNWSSPQSVTFTSAQDDDDEHSGGVFRVSTDDIEAVRKIYVFEKDDEAAASAQVDLVWPKGELAAIEGHAVKLLAEGRMEVAGVTNPEGSVFGWSKVSGPGNVTFSDAQSRVSGVVFSQDGEYKIRFQAEHPTAAGFATATVTVRVGNLSGESTTEYQFSPALLHDASADLDGDSKWENQIAEGSDDWTLNGGVAQTIADPAPQLAFIDAAYEFPGGAIPNGGSSGHLDAYGNGNASLEVWFKPNSLPVASQQVLWESGGDIGASLTLSGSQLRFAVDDGGSNSQNGAVAEATLAPTAANDGFVHCVGVIDLDGDEVRLYLDGALADTKAIASVSDWCGTSQSGLGTIVHNNGSETTDLQHLGGNDLLSGSFGTYTGQIAWFAFFNRALNPAEITDLAGGAGKVTVTNGYEGNIGPVVSAGADQSIGVRGKLVLGGTAEDDGQPDGFALVSLWHMISGPENPLFADASSPTTSVDFEVAGDYRFQLEADDGEIKVYDEVEIAVAGVSYEEWAEEEGLTSGQDQPEDNADGDSYSNVWEWVLGLNPDSYDAERSFGSVVPAEEGNELTFRFSFLVPRDRTPEFGIELSEQLVEWNPDSEVSIEVDTLDSAMNRWVLETGVDPDGIPRLFGRPVILSKKAQ